MKKTTISALIGATLSTFAINSQATNNPASGMDFVNQTISIQGSTIDFADLANNVTATGSSHQNAAPVSDANPHGGVVFWPHGASMNTDLEFDYSPAPIINGSGDDLAVFMWRPTVSYGGIIGVTINGVSKDILADIKIGERDGSAVSDATNNVGFFAGKIDLSDFGVSANAGADSLFISASQTSINGNQSGYTYAQIGSNSDVVFTGAASLDAAGDLATACGSAGAGGNTGACGGNGGATNVSEPSTLMLLGAVGGMMFFRRKSKVTA